MSRYFAYGANMDPEQMARRCPGATRLGIGSLPGWRFQIARAGYGTAVPRPGSVIHGVLWDLTAADETALDGFEGVPEGLYRKAFAVVEDRHHRRGLAMLYRARDPGPGVPVSGYVERIVELAESLGFPEAYLAELRGVLAVR